MQFGLITYGVGLLAGALSTLSPCVLPLIPIVIGSALAAHRRGPLVLAAGLAASFAVLGTLLAYAGTSFGVETGAVRKLGVGILGVFGLLLLSAGLQRRYALATAGLGNAGQALLARWRLDGLRGQFVVGLLLGVIWSPCVGPTLGAAIGLASQGRELAPIALLMFVFGTGAALPLLILGGLGHTAVARMRGSLVRAGSLGKAALGAAFVILAVTVLTGLDQRIESWAVDRAPAWLTDLTTRY